MTQIARPLPARVAPLLCAVAGLGLAGAAAAQDSPAASPPAATIQAPATPTPIMPLADVRVGMKGYGLTVFHGTKIEPFPVEVVSVINDFNPKRGTVWIRSDHPTLVVSGPVQGMSGSPIFLWEEGEAQTLGQGGKLIGAFAYGFSMVKECLAGVQPIELMHGVAGDINRDPQTEARRPAGSTLEGLATLHRLQSLAASRNVQPIGRFRLDALTRLAERQVRPGDAADAAPTLPPAPQGLAAGGVQRLMLPLSVGSPQVAELTAPLLTPLGLVPVAGGGIAGAPPVGVDAETTRLEPGSVLSIPLAFGDADLSAAGTVTDVLPDGTVLGFGHAMFGEGDVALPMATGYVHFFVPRITISFKQSGSLQLRGSLVQDQNAAVAGIGETRYRLAPASVSIDMPGYQESFNYQVVADYPQLTPTLALIVALQSMTASRQLPVEHTLYTSGEIAFSGDRTLRFDSISAGEGDEAPLMDLLPALTLLMNNPHENLDLASMQFAARVEPVLKVGTLVNARLEKAEVAPGETVRLTATVQPYGRPAELLHAELKVPEGLPEGDYPLALMDAASYTSQVLLARPHLQATTSVDDLFDTVQRIFGVKRDAVYLVLQLPQPAIAVGRSELPRLPSSRRAMIATPTSTLATPFMETAETMIPTEGVVQGQLGFQISVRRPLRAQLQPTDNKPK